LYNGYRKCAIEKNEPTILILDEFAGHMTSEVRDAVSSVGGQLLLIPGGYTWKLQPMDIGLNKPFKNKIRDIDDDWGYTNDYDAKPQREDVAYWIKHAWEQVTYQTMIRTWQKIGIHQPVPEEFDYDKELDLEGTDDGDGINTLDYDREINNLQQLNDEEEATEALYTDIVEDEVEIQ
jgi:DDE superfamily endonuclease